jgi:hypothetical protein
MLLETFVSCSGACFFKGSFLYWVKPIMKIQYVYGWSIHDTIKVLRQDPDRFRFFRGFMISTLQCSIGRTTDIVLYKKLNECIDDDENKRYVPVISGVCASSIKMAMMPLDTIANIYQVHGIKGQQYIKGNLYRGTLAYGTIHATTSSLWLSSFSLLNNHNIFNNANLNYLTTGFMCSFITDICVNPLRVIKTNKQTFKPTMTYSELVKHLHGSYYRGFKLRVVMNGLNSALFVLFWQHLENLLIYN